MALSSRTGNCHVPICGYVFPALDYFTITFIGLLVLRKDSTFENFEIMFNEKRKLLILKKEHLFFKRRH